MKVIIDNKVKKVEIEFFNNFDVYMTSKLNVGVKFYFVYAPFDMMHEIVQTFNDCDCTFVIYINKNRQSGFTIDSARFSQIALAQKDVFELNIEGENFRWI